MLKKMLALTLALVMAIMPMTASAVTWGEVVATLNDSMTFNKDNVEAHTDGSGYVYVGGTGEITGEGNVIVIDATTGGYSYYFDGVKLNADQIKVEANGEDIAVTFGEDTVVNGDVVSEADGKYTWVEIYNNGTINGDMTAAATGEYAKAANVNKGTVAGNMSVTTSDEASGYNDNYGTVGNMTLVGEGDNYNQGTAGNMTVTGSGLNYNFEDAVAGNMTVTGAGSNYNEGTAGNMTVTGEGGNTNWDTAGDMTVTVTGEGAVGGNMNFGTAGDMTATASGEGGVIENINAGTVENMNATASGKGSVVGNGVMGGTVTGSMNTEANAEGAVGVNIVEDVYDDEDNAYPPEVSNVTASASNGGTVVNSVGSELDSLTAVIGEGGKVIAGFVELEYDDETGTETFKPVTEPEAVNKEKVSNITIVIEAGAEDTYTAEQIKAMIEATGMEPTETVYYTVNADGERTAQYSIGTDGSLTFVRKLIEEYTAEELEYIKKMDKIARENHEREIKRHAEKLGGITASPEWVKQLFIGYMSLNLRMYEEGEQILFRERLAWADTDDGTLNLTLRVNIDEPKALTIRLDENVLDKLEQANISVVTLLAKDGTPVMQYKVSDLRGAYTQYGLTGTDLLVVGGADNDVMKIGADGVMKPVEAE